MKTLFVDVGMTLLGGPKESPSTFICNLLGIALENKSIISNIVFCKDVASPDELITSLEEELRITITDEKRLAIQNFWDLQVLQCQPLDGTENFCSAIIASKVNYYIVSNLWPPFFNALQTHLNDFIINASGLFLSYKIGSCKPSDIFYSHVYSAVSVPAENIIMFGDSFYNDMEPCIKRGSTGILLSMDDNPRSRPQTELKNLIRVKNHAQCLTVIKKINEGK